MLKNVWTPQTKEWIFTIYASHRMWNGYYHEREKQKIIVFRVFYTRSSLGCRCFGVRPYTNTPFTILQQSMTIHEEDDCISSICIGVRDPNPSSNIIVMTMMTAIYIYDIPIYPIFTCTKSVSWRNALQVHNYYGIVLLFIYTYRSEWLVIIIFTDLRPKFATTKRQRKCS